MRIWRQLTYNENLFSDEDSLMTIPEFNSRRSTVYGRGGMVASS